MSRPGKYPEELLERGVRLALERGAAGVMCTVYVQTQQQDAALADGNRIMLYGLREGRDVLTPGYRST